MTDPHVIIAGGGIGGVGAALMLGRRGISVTLLEREPRFAEGGYGLQLGPNVTRTLREEGVFEAITGRAVFPRRLVFRSALTGEVLNWLDCDDMERRYGARYLVMHRGDLLEALVQAATATGHVTLRTATKVVGFEDRGDGVAVSTEDGRTYVGQVLVGADGIHSRVRTAFVADEVRPTGFCAYRGTIPIEAADPGLDLEAVTVWFGPQLHLVQYPLRDSRELNQVAVFHSPAFDRGEEQWGTPDELLARFSADEGLHPAVVRGPRELSMTRGWPMVDRAPLSTYVKGRVALLGDAAHPMLQYLAQGAGQSLLDAAALAEVLAPLARSSVWSSQVVGTALAAYDAERVPQASRVQDTARWWGEMWHVTEPGAVMIRDEAFRLVDRYDYKYLDWLYGPVRHAAAPAVADPFSLAGRHAHARAAATHTA